LALNNDINNLLPPRASLNDSFSNSTNSNVFVFIDNINADGVL